MRFAPPSIDHFISNFFCFASGPPSNEEGTDWTVTNLRRYFLWSALYLALVFVMGQADYLGRPIINFASYFYLVAMIGVPVTLFFPSVTRVSTTVPLAVWAVVYVILTLVIDRGRTTTSNDLSVIVLEFMLLEIGIWFAHQLAHQISHAESVMDELATDAFPHRAEELDESSQRVKIEFNRSRRYRRPLSLLLMEVDPEHQKSTGEVLKSIQTDIVNRFTSARVGQIIDDCIRQTDLVLRDKRWRYVVLCPETDLTSALLLARRISDAVQEKTGLSILWGAAAFPEEALTFDDLMRKARERIRQGDNLDKVHQPESVHKETSNV
jgi:GGDEF domain-containing protein